uniref:Uncharacterized protein n=1 Tax=Glossina pallidipes TaxID=7398 RepID=A0A1B0A937_GLOPL
MEQQFIHISSHPPIARNSPTGKRCGDKKVQPNVCQYKRVREFSLISFTEIVAPEAPRRAVSSSAQLLGDNRPASVLKASCTELKSLIRPRGFISRRSGSSEFLRHYLCMISAEIPLLHEHIKPKQGGLDYINEGNANEVTITFVDIHVEQKK